MAFYCSVVVCSLLCLQFELGHFWPGKSRHCACTGRGTAVWWRGAEWLTLLRHSPWLWLVVLSREWWILANQITATGWSHRQWIFTQLTCILFQSLIIVAILANRTKNCYFNHRSQIMVPLRQVTCFILKIPEFPFNRWGREDRVEGQNTFYCRPVCVCVCLCVC